MRRSHLPTLHFAQMVFSALQVGISRYLLTIRIIQSQLRAQVLLLQLIRSLNLKVCFPYIPQEFSQLQLGSSFPLISDTLGLNPQGDGTTGSAPSILLQRSRAPLRASTFDGRSIFIRRKPHLAQQHKVRLVGIAFWSPNVWIARQQSPPYRWINYWMYQFTNLWMSCRLLKQ